MGNPLLQQLFNVAASQGLDLQQMQDTYKNIYDGFLLDPGVYSFFEFFTNCASRPKFQTNVNQNKFEVGEAMQVLAIQVKYEVSEEEGFTNTTYPDAPLEIGFIDLIIGNQVVLKKVPCKYQVSTVGKVDGGASYIYYLESPISILPQTEFSVRLYNFNLTVEAETNAKIQCNLLGDGVLYTMSAPNPNSASAWLRSQNFSMQNRQISTAIAKSFNLGFVDVSDMQGTTRVLYQNKSLTAANGSYVTFFEDLGNTNGNNKSIEINQLEAGEMVVVKEISLFSSIGISINLNGNATFSLRIGNQRVLKNIPLSELFNNSGYNNLKSTGDGLNYSMRLIPNIIIPPQVEFAIELDQPEIFDTEDYAFAIKGYGKLLNINRF